MLLNMFLILTLNLSNCQALSLVQLMVFCVQLLSVVVARLPHFLLFIQVMTIVIALSLCQMVLVMLMLYLVHRLLMVMMLV